MTEIVQERVKIISEIEFVNILKLIMTYKKDEHTYVEIQGIVNHGISMDVVSGYSGSLVIICDIENDKEILFSGIIEEIEIKCAGMLHTVRLQCFSHTILMDREVKNCSYQNMKMTYRNIIEDVTQEIENRVIIYGVQDRKMESLVIRYQETDWQFVKRIASYMGVSIIPIMNTRGVGLSIGLRDGGEHSIADSARVKYIITKDKCLYYELINQQAWEIGDKVIYKEHKLYVVEKRAEFIKSTLQYTYILADRKYLDKKPYENINLKGISLKGTAIAVEKEQIKIHLQIDDSQKTEEAYWFPYLPETGNIMYCMPEIGDMVCLYMGCGWEQNAIAINCNREGSGEREGTFLITPYGKKIILDKTRMGYDSSSENGHGNIWLQDEKIMIGGNNEIKITAENILSIQATNIQVVAPEEITLMRRDMLQPSVINLCHFVDMIAERSGVRCKKEIGEIKTISSEVTVEETYELAGVTKNILATIPFDGMQDSVAQCLFKSAGYMEG
ncbi:MAG: hypothetical protein NC118_03450 [Eubacterium sp.]|nr:hypothetical protein [Eubacterium sp.]